MAGAGKIVSAWKETGGQYEEKYSNPVGSIACDADGGRMLQQVKV